MKQKFLKVILTTLASGTLLVGCNMGGEEPADTTDTTVTEPTTTESAPAEQPGTGDLSEDIEEETPDSGDLEEEVPDSGDLEEETPDSGNLGEETPEVETSN